ncbi:MAG: DUF1365 domain-containing protein [Pseudomonadota bacterium]
MSPVDHIRGETFHGRRGPIENAFRYGVDYILLDPEAEVPNRWYFARNRSGLTALHDVDHGGAPGFGRGAAWVREVLSEACPSDTSVWRLQLLAQPRVMGHVFNPVSFWLIYDPAAALRTVIAEVTNTYGDRHCYLCHHENFGPIKRSDTMKARKILHVSPFQPVDGGYRFRFDIRADRVGIWIDYRTGNEGLYATLTGRRRPMTAASVLSACLRRPFGSRRVLGLIHWQALKLWWKGAAFRSRPVPPAQEVSR